MHIYEGSNCSTAPNPTEHQAVQARQEIHEALRRRRRDGNLLDILDKWRHIQNHLPNSRKLLGKTIHAKTFQKLMSAGKISSSPSGRVLTIDDVIPGSSQNNETCTVCEVLIEKHPPGKPASPNSLIQGLPTPTNLILFENLSGDAIYKATLKHGVHQAYQVLMLLHGEDSVAYSRHWYTLLTHGLSFGFYPNASKTHLIVKKIFLSKALNIFSGTNINMVNIT